ncbi:hypothetical protein PG994_004186 [Apiospora phragmitis]|uniref:DUF7136 domain-containing protein n=1 Tax=Apiospora phragmitis TaxID=2905665 RepID=A0ABR1VQ55_9PEZI
MTPVFALWAWLLPHLLLLQHLVGAATAASSPPPSSSLGNTIEADLIFPHEGGRYTNAPNGIPVVIGIQNAAVAARFGFKLRWQLLEAPNRRGEVSVKLGGGAYPSLSPGNTDTDVNATAPSFPWSTTAKITGHLVPGDYTLRWSLGLVPYCDFGNPTRPRRAGGVPPDTEVAQWPPLVPGAQRHGRRLRRHGVGHLHAGPGPRHGRPGVRNERVQSDGLAAAVVDEEQHHHHNHHCHCHRHRHRDNGVSDGDDDANTDGGEETYEHQRQQHGQRASYGDGGCDSAGRC